MSGIVANVVEQGLLARAHLSGGPLSSMGLAPGEALTIDYEPGEEVVGDGDPVESYLLVVEGLFRAVKMTPDGRRQIFAFYSPGEMCGLEPGNKHALSIEAVGKGRMASISRHACRTRMDSDPRLNLFMFESATRAIAQSVGHMTMIGRSSAEERLAWFLISMCDKAGNMRTVDLAMSRMDIADYLGLTIETVSRTFTSLKARGLIAMPSSRRILLVDPKSIKRIAEADRDTPAWAA